MTEASKALVQNTEIALPDEFLKRWLIETNEGKLDEKEISDNYNTYRDSIKWQLIESKLIDTYKLEVSTEEVKNYFKDALVRNYFPTPADATEDQIKETEAARSEEHTSELQSRI